MDWPVTARTTEPHVRETIADRELETWLVVDLSPSLDFGTAACEKRDLAVAARAAVVHLTRAAATGSARSSPPATGCTAPGAAGRAHAHGLLRRSPRHPARQRARRGDLPGALESLRRPPRRRGLVVVVSDFLGDVDWDRALRALRARHDLLAIEVVDPRERSCPTSGWSCWPTPRPGGAREIDTTPTLRRRFAAEAAAHRERVATALRAAGRGAPGAAHRSRLGRRRRALRRGPQARLVRGSEHRP